MSYIGSTPTTQSFIAGTDYFNGNGSAVNFTLSRSVNSVNDIEVIVNNVEQIPSGYSVSGTTLTFSAAPSAGTSNVYVRYLSTTNLSLAIPAGTSATFNTVTVADGSATTPSITNDGDTNTGIFFPAADTIAFAEGGAEAMRIDSSGNVGIGTTTPTAVFTNYKSLYLNGSSGSAIQMQSNGSLASNIVADTNALYLQNITAITFNTGGTGTGTERARIDSSGNFLSANGAIYFTSAQYRSNVASSQLQFINNGSGVSLAVNGTSWGSLSDERDKEIIEPITDAVSKVSTLRSVIGRYKIDDADKRRAFLIAQDVKAVLPEAVTELDDEQKTLILQYTEVIPLLVAAIKEQQTLITALTTRITALENNNATQQN